MKFSLVTHEKELDRTDNSGALLESLQGIDSCQILWRRTQPDPQLVKAIEAGEAVLLTQQGGGEQLNDISHVEHLIILDGTWQEARKMYNKSPYLKQAKWFCFNNPAPTRYTLRRNQVAGGLCTAECAIEVLKVKGLQQPAIELDRRFTRLIGNARHLPQY